MSPKAKQVPVREVTVHSSIREAAPYWNEVVSGDRLFLQPEYLGVLESCPPRGMGFRYAMVWENGVPVAAIYGQVQYFQGAESIRYHRQGPPPRCFFQTFGQHLKGLVARQVGFNTLVCGNLMLSGAHGYALREDRPDAHALIETALQAIRRELERQGNPISVTLVKDFEPDTGPEPQRMRGMRYHPFRILPSLIMDLDPDWTSFDDYLGALSSKYRVRAKKARQLLNARLTRATLDLAGLRAAENEVYALYQRVVDDSGFNVITLHPSYFTALKAALGEKVLFQGYYHQGTLIGFISAIRNTNGELEAHFLGYLEDWNPTCKLYLNMLFDLVELGIAWGCRRIIFARTADEIKSSVGAVPVPLDGYIRHRSPFSNKFIGPLLDYLTPKEEPTLRHPFRKEETAESSAALSVSV